MTFNGAIGEPVMRQFVDSLSVPVFLVSRSGVVEVANRAAWAQFGDKSGQLEGRNLAELNSPEFGEELRRVLPKILTGQTDDIVEMRLPDRVWHWFLSPQKDATGCAERIIVCLHDVTSIQQRVYREMQSDMTRTLVKEVRHSLKNRLQGIVGLLREHCEKVPETANVIDGVITQLLSISAVYGIEASVGEDRIYLCSLVNEVVAALKSIYPTLDINKLDAVRMVALSSEAAVPVALIINELLTNAVKHTPAVLDRKIRVELKILGRSHAELTIFNAPAELAKDLNFVSGRGLGAGLQLVRSLLPIQHVQLRIANRSPGVAVVLELQPPFATLQAS